MTPDQYRITIEGSVPGHLFNLLDADRVTEVGQVTEFECEVRDPAELAGVLEKLCSIGLMATSVCRSDLPGALLRVDAISTRIRARAAGVTLLDSSEAHLVYVVGEHAEYAVPSADVNWSEFVRSESTEPHVVKGDATVWALADAPESAALFAWSRLDGLCQLRWDAADLWLEEDAPALFRAKDPYRRVDAYPSSTSVRYEIDGQAIAASNRPLLVMETGLPPCWYLPIVDFDESLLAASRTTSGCQYKGEASYWSVVAGGVTHKDLVWTYRAPMTSVSQLVGVACVAADRVDTYLDGVLQTRPVFDPAWLNPSFAR